MLDTALQHQYLAMMAKISLNMMQWWMLKKMALILATFGNLLQKDAVTKGTDGNTNL